MPFIIFCIVCFVIFFGYHIITLIYAIGKFIVVLIAAILDASYKSDKMDVNMYRLNKIKKAESIKRMNDIKMELKEREKQNIQYKGVMTNGIINKVNELKYKYPNADNRLINEYKKNALDYTIVELDQLEDKILQSHIHNIKN